MARLLRNADEGFFRTDGGMVVTLLLVGLPGPRSPPNFAAAAAAASGSSEDADLVGRLLLWLPDEGLDDNRSLPLLCTPFFSPLLLKVRKDPPLGPTVRFGNCIIVSLFRCR